MSFHLTIKGGDDDGATLVVEGQCIIGRAPACQLRLSDPLVSWEHAVLSDQDGRLFLQNLSAAGVQVGGRPVTGEVRVGNGEEIEIGGDLKILVEERVGDNRRHGSNILPIVLGALAVCIVIVFSVAAALQEEEPAPNPLNLSHWRTAYNRLEVRMTEWEARGEFPEEALTLFRDAWRLEIDARNPGAGAKRWDSLRSLFLTLPQPGDDARGRTIAEAAGTTTRALNVIMGRATDTSMSMDSRWRADDAHADALSWFVQRRAQGAHNKMEAEQ